MSLKTERNFIILNWLLLFTIYSAVFVIAYGIGLIFHL